MDKITDNELIDSILAGNIRDYSLLVKRYQVAAYNLSLRMLRNTMDAEEVVQDSFIKAYHGLVNFRREAKFSTW
ncbi:MAG: RNA polymerase subunit sigma, partial [Ignavibacteria bacterium]|nr:RNA polymerase subunit sigma [Ignavibacteria bacterium]